MKIAEREREKIAAAVLSAVIVLNEATNEAVRVGLITTLDIDADGDVYIEEISRVYYFIKKDEKGDK